MRTGIGILITGLALGVIFTSTLRAKILYDASMDFSLASNPNGVWSYGYSNVLGGELILYTDNGTSAGGLEFWWLNLYLGAPSVAYNPTSSILDLGTPVYGPGQLGCHPGPNGQNCVIRFTVPMSGTYRMEAWFVGIDEWGTTTDVHVLINGVSLFDGLINGYGPGTLTGTSSDVALNAGDRVDFAVGFRNGSFYNDSTGIEARLSYDPCGEELYPYPLGDFTMDCYVNLPDFAALAEAWQSGQCDADNQWCNGLDLSQNGDVGLDDMTVLAGAWLSCTDPTPPCSFIP